MYIIEAHNVSKSYGLTTALNDLSLNVDEGSVYALLGPNGSGKTTFVKSILDLVKPDSGEIKINGFESKNIQSREKISYLPEKFSFYPYYTVTGILQFYGAMRGLKGGDLNDQVNEALELLQIKEIARKKIKQCSKGQVQRTGIAAMLMGTSDLLILDEPFSGLDPIGIKELKDLLLNLKNGGKTLFINSHILSEMEKLCDHAAILNKGEVIAQGELKSMIGEQSLEDYFYDKVKK